MATQDEAVDTIRALARQHLKEAGAMACPTDLKLLCRYHHVRLLLVPCRVDPSYPGGIVTDLRSDFRVIVVNSLLRPARLHFTIAHELGHVAHVHQEPRRPEDERVANIYASELLVPTERLLSQLHRYGPNAPYLAKLNGVSLRMMWWRLLEVSKYLVRE